MNDELAYVLAAELLKPVRVNVNPPGEVPSWQTGVLHWDDMTRLLVALDAEAHIRARIRALAQEWDADARGDTSEAGDVTRHHARQLHAALGAE